MPTTARPTTAQTDALVIQVSTVGRQAARRPLILHNLADADDIAQDVTLDCLAGFRSGKQEIITTDVARFVWTLPIRRALNVARAADRRDTRATASIQDEGEVRAWMSHGAMVEYAELEALAALAVAALPLMCRRVFLVVGDDDTSYAAIALTLSITRDTPSEHLETGQPRLRAALVDAVMIASHMPRTCPPRVTCDANEAPAQ